MTASAGERKASVPFLAVTALGVVYGDIGTSPLYALRECFFGSHAVPPSYDNVLGVLSLVVYSLLFIISVKYVVVVMRADNQGEGGILALTALISGEGTPRGSRALLVTLGLFGAALLYGDGMITPAISRLGREAWPGGASSCSSGWCETRRARRPISDCRQIVSSSSVSR